MKHPGFKLRNRCSYESTGPYADKNAASLRMAQRHNGHKDKGLEYSPGEQGPSQSNARGILVRDLQIQLAWVFRGGCRGDSGMDSGTVAETKTPGTSIPMEAGTVKGAVKKKG